MKKEIFIGLFSLVLGNATLAQNTEPEKVKEAIRGFAKAGDESNTGELEQYLDPNYRIVLNRLFGSNEVNIITKPVYLEKIKNKEFGGDKRDVTIENLVIVGTSATAKVTFKGTKTTFISLITLIKTEAGVWKLVNEVPVMV